MPNYAVTVWRHVRSRLVVNAVDENAAIEAAKAALPETPEDFPCGAKGISFSQVQGDPCPGCSVSLSAASIAAAKCVACEYALVEWIPE